MGVTREAVMEALSKVTLPSQQKDIASLGKVQDIKIGDGSISIVIAVTVEESKFNKALSDNIKYVISKFIGTGINVDVQCVTTRDETDEFGISRVKNIVAVASGKGGVGKSTVTVNLAVSLARKGYKVGVIDADIFGPSIPRMFGVEGELPYSREVNGKHVIIPVEKFGVKLLSIGFFVKPQDSLAWRGPMASGALKQLINDTDWGDLDILLFDTPPGTSDIHLTILQTLPLTGAIIVTTPQDVALIDAVRGIDLFKKENVNVPLLGLIENMSWFTPAELPNNRYYIFGKGGGERLAREAGVPLLGQLPLVQGIREGGDSGEPPASTTDAILEPLFSAITTEVLKQLEERNKTLPPSKQLLIKL